MFETLLDSDLPPYDKSVGRLVQDAQTMVGAGSATTSFSLALGTYYILTDPSVLDKLMEELETAMPSATYEPLSLVELEKLEYLEAIRLEILRISHGVMHRLQRVCPNQAIQYKDHTIPPGTPISMSSGMIHNDPSIFPEPSHLQARALAPPRHHRCAFAEVSRLLQPRVAAVHRDASRLGGDCDGHRGAFPSVWEEDGDCGYRQGKRCGDHA
ncbi:hypothetical protein XPA_009907 [Xanthoria parietina]